MYFNKKKVLKKIYHILELFNKKYYLVFLIVTGEVGKDSSSTGHNVYISWTKQLYQTL